MSGPSPASAASSAFVTKTTAAAPRPISNPATALRTRTSIGGGHPLDFKRQALPRGAARREYTPRLEFDGGEIAIRAPRLVMKEPETPYITLGRKIGNLTPAGVAP